MDADLPMAQLAELFNVNHFIVSQVRDFTQKCSSHASLTGATQVNPHAALFSNLSLSALARESSNPLLGMGLSAVGFLKSQIRAWLNNVVTLITFTNTVPRSAFTRGLVQVSTSSHALATNHPTVITCRSSFKTTRAVSVT